MTKIIGYCRVSTDKQSTDIQRQIILDYCHMNDLKLTEIIEKVVSSQLDRKYRLIDEAIEKLDRADILVVYSLCRIGRSTIETLRILEDLKSKGIRIIIIKDRIDIDPNKSDPTTTMLISMLSAFAEFERSLISERTKAGLKKVKDSGRKLGRPYGSKNKKSKYHQDKDRIIELIELGLSYNKVCLHLGYGTPQGVFHYYKAIKDEQSRLPQTDT